MVPLIEFVAAQQRGLINRFTARQYCTLACAAASEDNCSNKKICLAKPSGEVTASTATVL
jgi:hypothetical protein